MLKYAIEDIFSSGRWVSYEEYEIECPFCGDHEKHKHCNINLKKRVFHCYLCGEGGTLRKLTEEVFKDKNIFLEDYSNIDDELFINKARKETQITEIKRNLIDFYKFETIHKNCDKNTYCYLAFEYLNKRGISYDNINEYSIRYSNMGRYFGRIILPVFENKEIVTFSARSFIEDAEPKYLNPHRGETILNFSEAIFNIDKACKDVDYKRILVFTEGIFDAIGIEKANSDMITNSFLVGISVLTKNISDAQITKILRIDRNKNEFVLMLDSEKKDKNINESILRIVKKFSESGMQIRVARLSEGDPASAKSYEIAQAVGKSRKIDIEANINLILQ